jgi:CheY-like chemotaxis protein
MEKLGWRVVEAETCARAEALWSGGPFDLVVLDHRLADGFGSDLLARMRQQGRAENVIYLSADAGQIDLNLARALDIRAVLAKPLNQSHLQLALSDLQLAAGGNGRRARA